MSWRNVALCPDCGEWHLEGFCPESLSLLEKGSEETENDEETGVVESGMGSTDEVSAGIHCTRGNCHNKVVSELCGILDGSKIVPLGTPGSKVECKSLKDCKGYSSTGGYNWSQFSTSKCRHAPTEVYKLSGITFYGGSESRVEKLSFDSDWTVISLLGDKKKSIIWSRLPNVVKKLGKFIVDDFTPDISLDWRDYSAPPVGPGFWSALLEYLLQAKSKHVLFFCMGGHGRTGTALASMLVECCDMGPMSSLTYVRKNYCKEAIESSSQKEYLNNLYKVDHEGEGENNDEIEKESGKETKYELGKKTSK